jgi:hypothetical protein
MMRRPKRGPLVIAAAFSAGVGLQLALALDLAQNHRAILAVLALLVPLMTAAAVLLVRENLNRG